MFCGQCGAENPDNGKFCTTCGAPLGGETPVQSNQQQLGVTPVVQQYQPEMQQPQPIVQQSQITGFDNDVSSNDADFKPENQKEKKIFIVVIWGCMVVNALLMLLGKIGLFVIVSMLLLIYANTFWATAAKAKTREEYAAAMNKCKINAVIAAIILVVDILLLATYY